MVNSVMRNSNNRKVTMENLPPGASYEGEEFDGHDGRDNNNYGGSTTPTLQMQATSAASPSEQQQQQVVSIQTQARPETKAQVPDYLKAIGMDPKRFWPKKYRFTREKSPGEYNPLSIAQRNFFENNGYIVIDDCCSQKLLEAIKREHREASLVSEFLVEKLVAKNGKLLQYVKCFCDERLMLMTHRLVETFQTKEQAKAIMDNKQAQRQQLFRDWIYLPFRPIDKVTCAITAVEPLDHVILVVPGTHRVGQCTISSTLESISAAYETSQERSPQISRGISKELFECSPENLSSLVEGSRKGFKYVNLKAGQTLFYHPGLVHGFSDDLVNFNKRQLATIAYYAAADCEYVDMRRQEQGPDQQQQQQQVPLPISLAHFGSQDPSDYSSWLNRPRLIEGHKASL